ncbi:MAG: DUF333 domain-containing protein [Gammaproteobacteria bacterium]|nr:DUF333 domain-containing protein [Gammaproteobacteria bacterium]
MKKFIFILALGFTANSFALPNPAATNCTAKGYQYLLVKNSGICIFPDNSYCEEWSYLRGQCRPGQNKLNIPSNPSAPKPLY